jgi:2-oxoglutarate dehydrogenase complex dehydrogenase (E1) component-like enzyme
MAEETVDNKDNVYRNRDNWKWLARKMREETLFTEEQKKRLMNEIIFCQSFEEWLEKL